MDNHSLPLLGFGIITYNRDYLLDLMLDELISLIRKYQFPVYVCDNCSTDQTQRVCEKYQQEYKYLYYVKQNENVGADANFRTALRVTESRYQWLLTDGSRIIPNNFNQLLNILNENKYDFIVTGFEVRTDHLKTRSYSNCNVLLGDIGWHMTQMGCTIYKRDLYDRYSFDRYNNSKFLQTGIVFEYIANHPFHVYFYNDLKITNIPLPKRGHWDDKTIEIFAMKWYAFVMSLPIKYSLEMKERCIIKHGQLTHIFEPINVASLRAASSINIKQLIKYGKYLRRCTNLMNYLFAYVICLVPPFVCVGVKYLYKKALGREFSPDRGSKQVENMKPRL